MTIRQEIRDKWKPRPAAAHKGSFGRVLIIAGSEGMSGAAHLASAACLRSGAGLATLAVPKPIYPIVARLQPEIMVRPFPATKAGTFSQSGEKLLRTLLKKQNSAAIGPGLSQNPE